MLLRLPLILIACVLHGSSWLDERLFIPGWLGIALLFWCVRGESGIAALTTGFLSGCLMLGIAFHWAIGTLAYTLDSEPGDWLPYVAFAGLLAWESIPFALLCWCVAKSDRGELTLWAAPLLWAPIEMFWPRVFPWSFSHCQTGFPSFVQAAEWGGAPLVSFFFIAGCIGASQIVASTKKNSFQAEIMVASAILCGVFGLLRKSALDHELAAEEKNVPLRVRVVQVDPSYVDSTEKMRRQIDAGREAVDLIILPESTLGTYRSDIDHLAKMRRDIQTAREPFINVEPFRGLSADLLVGGKIFEGGADESGPYYQTAFVIDPSGKVRDRYFKRYLLPIGEYAPFEATFPQFHEWVQLEQYIERGTSSAPMVLSGGAKVGVLICYEDTIPAAARTTAVDGAELLICIINGSAFESPVALDQHRRLAQLRAVENRRPFLRCAATGATCYVSATGEMRRSLPHFTEGAFQVTAPRLTRQTVYMRFGYLFPYVCIPAAAACLLRSRRQRASRRKRPLNEAKSPAASDVRPQPLEAPQILTPTAVGAIDSPVGKESINA